jgi:hypothetical protein
MSDAEKTPIEHMLLQQEELMQRVPTLRDYFAAAALTGMLSDETTVAESVSMAALKNSKREVVIAHWAYTQADAMLKAREVDHAGDDHQLR